MNTHGHHRVADEAGLPRLQQAFAELGVDNVDLTAFYLGNWLTDLSQLMEPNEGCLSILAGKAGARMKTEIGPIVAALQSFVEDEVKPAYAPPAAAADLDGWVKNTKKKLSREAAAAGQQFALQMQDLLARLTTLAKQKAPGYGLNDLIKVGVKFSAYAKFAHSDPKLRKPGLDFRVFSELFDRNFTQALPHEHLDRPHCRFTLDPECETSWGRHAVQDSEGLYASQLVTGERAVGSSAPSMYNYLDEDRKIVSGLLTRIDRDWAKTYLTVGVDHRTDLGFHLGLADLGHALHAVEDFFAHSNFIEHAAALRGEAYLRATLYAPATRKPDRDQLNQTLSDFAATKVMRRLKRYEPDVEKQEVAGWAFLPDETNIVTGYFDCWDTLVSLLHTLEEIFEFHEPQTAQDIFTDYLQRYGSDRLDELVGPITDIAKTWKSETAEGRLRRHLRILLEYYTETRALSAANAEAAGKHIRQCIREQSLFEDVPPEFIDIVVRLVYHLVNTRLVAAQSGRVTWNLFQLIKAVVEIFKNPLAFLAEPLNLRKKEGVWFNAKFLGAWVYKIFFDTRFDALRFGLRTRLHAALRGYRIGSHSLLAKDYADEPLFSQAFNCARSLHWYVVDTLCRWSDPAWLQEAGEGSTWIDWDQLLGAFLTHPLGHAGGPVSKQDLVTISGFELVYVPPAGSTFREIVLSHLPAGAEGGTRVYGNYEEVLVANLHHAGTFFQAGAIGGTYVDENRVAELVESAGMGTRSRGAYTLRPGLPVWIPFSVDVMRDRLDETTWFSDVMDLSTEEWRRHVAAYRASKSTMSRPYYQYHRPVYHQADGRKSDISIRDQFIKASHELATTLTNKYNRPDKPSR